ncbi:hypothetical protein X943_001517 [Babesia divergens]|uniref:Uncharacterized protein n=1 Tax=Babesia divergens TaxID=32595 RepID=A0AAD9G716_BABDI|nr:hypothetical protein X943_001517 [Babesia divergens]
MEGHKIVLSDEFLEDFCSGKDDYSKTGAQINSNTGKLCRRWEHELSKCLTKCFDSIQESSRAKDANSIDDKMSRDFRNILQCSHQFKEYEACIQKLNE